MTVRCTLAPLAALSLLAVLAFPARGQAPAKPCFDPWSGLPLHLPAATPLPWGRGTVGALAPATRTTVLRNQSGYWRQTLPPCPANSVGRTAAPPTASLRLTRRLPTTLPPATAPGQPASNAVVRPDGQLPNPTPEEIPGNQRTWCGDLLQPSTRSSRPPVRPTPLPPGLGMGAAAFGGQRGDPGVPLRAGVPLTAPECLTSGTLTPTPVPVGLKDGGAVPQPSRPTTPVASAALARSPQLTAPPPLGGAIGATPAMSTLPPLLPSWTVSCADAQQRYRRWFAGLPSVTSGPQATSWVAGWGALATAEWRLACVGDRVTHVMVRLTPHDPRAEGVTALGQSVRRWVARIYPASTTLQTSPGDPQGFRPSVGTYQTDPKATALSPVLRMLVFGGMPRVELHWSRDPAAALPQ